MNEIILDNKNNIFKINGQDVPNYSFLQVKFENGEWSYIIADKNPFTELTRVEYDN